MLNRKNQPAPARSPQGEKEPAPRPKRSPWDWSVPLPWTCPRCLLDVAPKDSGKPKLTWAGDVTRLAEDRKEVGRENREAVLNVFQPGERLQGGKVEERMRASGSNLGRAAIRGHLKALSEEEPPRLTREGKNRETAYRLSEPSSIEKAGLDGEGQDDLFSKD